MTATRAASGRYTGAQIALHWIMFLLIVGVYAMIELREFFPKDSDPRNFMKMMHFSLGLTVLAFVIVRLAVRFTSPPAPPTVPAPPAWQEKLAGMVHALLYVLMIAMPIGGWLMLSALGKHIPFFGFELPAIIGENKPLGSTIEEIHETFGNIGMFLIGLHAVGAIVHHHVMKDNTMIRMMPAKK